MSTIQEDFYEFTKETTCHGLRQISKQTNSSILSALWAILILLMVGGMSAQLSYKITEYMEFAVTTDLSREVRSNMDFPGVTICNFNRFFNFTNIKELVTVDALLRSSTSRDETNDSWWNSQLDDFIAARNISKFLLTEELLQKGWQLNDQILQRCKFRQKPCSAKDFLPVITSMGICFTFKPKHPYQSIPGSKFGLVVTLDIQQHLYSEHPKFGISEAGVKVILHKPDEIALPEEYGIAVPSGKTAHIVVNEIQSKLMHKPWGVCSRDVPFMEYYKPYTFRGCLRECRLQEIIRQCNCTPYWAPSHRIHECDAYEVLNCAGPVEASYIQNVTIKDCKCVQPCETLTYESRVSYATFPSNAVGAILSQHKYENEEPLLFLTHDLNLDGNNHFRQYQDNHLEIDIYFDTPAFTKLVQSKKVTETSLFSDLGGLLGLWLGISLVTVGEMVQFLAQSLFKKIAVYKNESTNEKQQEIASIKCKLPKV